MTRHSETIPGVSRTLLRDQAYIALVRAIVAGDLAPGDALKDGDLASQLGLSRTPVREALARLVDDGLVVTKPNAFTRVAPLNAAAARDAAVLTQTLHGLAAHLASSAGRFTAEHAIQARSANTAFAAALHAGDLYGALAADDDLHRVFVRAAGNRHLGPALDRVGVLLRRHTLQRFATLPGRRSIQVHARLIDAAAAGDAETARSLAEENWATLVALIDQAAPDAPDAPSTIDDGDARATR